MSNPPPNFDELWDYQKAAETEKKFLELLPLAETANDPAYSAELLSQIARAQGLQGQFDNAHKTLDKAEGLLQPDFKRARVRILLERGRAFNSSQQPEKSLPLFEEAMKLATDYREDYYAVDAAHMLGIAGPEKDRHSWNLKALQMAEDSEDERAQGWKGSLYNNIGYFYMEEGKYAEAMDLFEKLLVYTTEKGDEDFANTARWFIAKTQRLMGHLEEALKGQLDLEKRQQVKAQSDAYVFEELGEIYLALQDDDARKKYFALAHELFSKEEQYNYIVKFEKERLDRIKELSN
jgi:tetratricopeptide (TPR) repeat protein